MTLNESKAIKKLIISAIDFSWVGSGDPDYFDDEREIAIKGIQDAVESLIGVRPSIAQVGRWLK